MAKKKWTDDSVAEFIFLYGWRYGISKDAILATGFNAASVPADPTDAEVVAIVNSVFSYFNDVPKVRAQDVNESSSAVSEDWADLDSDTKDDLLELFREIGFEELYDNREEVEELLRDADKLSELESSTLNVFMALKTNKSLYDRAKQYFPGITVLMDLYEKLVTKTANLPPEDDEQVVKVPKSTFEQQFRDAFGSEFVIDSEFLTTQNRVEDWMKENLKFPNVLPTTIAPWEMRLGGSRFLVPPISIQVNEVFQTGSMGGTALRQRTTPKFNSGHSDTMVSLTLYFPNEASIWGFEGDSQTIDFNDPEQIAKIDSFMSSLRGLITQFKYAPIVPVKNEYLNRTYGITAVAFDSMTVSTVESFPFCVSVNLQLRKFNHQVFLPMIQDFNAAMHWGKYRQYVGRAAEVMDAYSSQRFFKEAPRGPDGKLDIQLNPFGNDPPSDGSSHTLDNIVKWDKRKDLGASKGSRDWQDGKHFEIWYPKNSPGRIFAADTSSWRQYGEDEVTEESSSYNDVLSILGFDGSDPESLWDYLNDWDQNYSGARYGGSEKQVVIDYFESLGSLESAKQDKLDEYIAKRMDEIGREYAKNGETWDETAQRYHTSTIKSWWYWLIFSRYRLSPVFTGYLQKKEFEDGQFRIPEWKVPMERLDLDYNKVVVQGLSVSLANNFARLQLQMQDDPTLQYIGGKDCQISLALTVFGEDDLIRLRRMFDHVGSLARLEHAHAVLGFLGVRNAITTLCGIKYVLPLDLQVNTIPGYPHVYEVNLTFTDFDIEQQRREDISEQQQAELIEAFGKRNPFLRIKQLWGHTNAYPDMPLTIRDKKDKIIGQLDPDFYFKSFATYDDPMVDWDLDNRASMQAAAKLVKGTEKIVDTIAGIKNSHKEGEEKSVATESDQERDEKWVGEVGEGELIDLPKGAFDKYVNPDKQTKLAINATNYFFMAESTQSLAGMRMHKGDLSFGSWDLNSGKFSEIAEPSPIYDEVPELSLTNPIDPKGDPATRLTPFAEWGNTYLTGGSVNVGDPSLQFQSMMKDAQYRDVSGRMVRAYPTYMLWLIDEGGRFAGVKLFDNFYGLQSVIDFSLHRSEDVLGDTLVLRLSNLYKTLTTPYSQGLIGAEDDVTDAKDLVDLGFIREDNLLSGTQDVIREIDTVRLKPGVRLHLRCGYSANPNALETVFNGTITTVTAGDIVEVIAQSDAIELSAYINTTNNQGHSGKIDGAINTGFYLSEPRDLMVRLLSMGSSTFRENLAHALNGMIFSENRYGIRHFGSILYEPMGKEEAEKHNKRYNQVKSATDQFVRDVAWSTGGPDTAETEGLGEFFSSVTTGGFSAFTGEIGARAPVIPLIHMMMSNFFRNRDYELFKRNIYPGNGTGVAQFLGGDFPEAGLIIAQAAGPDVNQQINITSPEINVDFRDQSRDKNLEKNTRLEVNNAKNETQTNFDPNAINATESEALAEAQQRELDAQLNDDTGHDAGAGNIKVGHDLSDADPLYVIGAAADLVGSGWDIFSGLVSGNSTSPVLQALGVTAPGAGDDDLPGFDEVSFRASTYMKTIWDLFQLCSALLPNYIVAVRPFEDRSTVFYGKPHWLYTSGVLPVSKGLKKSANPFGLEPDKELKKLMQDIANEANPLADLKEQLAFRKELDTISPIATTDGMPFSTGSTEAGGAPTIDSVASLPLNSPDNKIKLPFRSGPVGLGLHLPVTSDSKKEVLLHKQAGNLGDLKSPKFMRREGSDDFNKVNKILKDGGSLENYGKDAKGAYKPSAYGYFDKKGFGPEEEQWYIGGPWPYKSYDEKWGGKPKSNAEKGEKWAGGGGSGSSSGSGFIDKINTGSSYRGTRVAVFNQRTQKTCICAIGDELSSDSYAYKLSPDSWMSLECKADDEIVVGWVDPKTPLGPVDSITSVVNSTNNAAAPPADPAATVGTTPDATATGFTDKVAALFGTGTSKDATSSVDMRSSFFNFGAGEITEAQIKEYLDRVKTTSDSGETDYDKTVEWFNKSVGGDTGLKFDSTNFTADILSDQARDNFIKGWNMEYSGDYTPQQDGGFWDPGILLYEPYRLDPVGHFARRLIDRNYNEHWANKDKGELVAGKDFESNFDVEFADLGDLKDLAVDKFKTTKAPGDAAADGVIERPDIDINNDGTYSQEEIEGASILRLADELWGDFKKYWKRNSPDDHHIDEIFEMYKNEGGKYGDYAWNTDHPLKEDDDSRQAVDILVDGYKKFLWQHAYSRAWLVVTTNVHTDNTSLPFTDPVSGEQDVDNPIDITGNKDLMWNFKSSAVADGFAKWLEIAATLGDHDWKQLMEIPGFPSEAPGRIDANGNPILVTEADFGEDHPATKMLSWLRENSAPGQKKYDLLGQLVNTLTNAYDSTIGRLLDLAGNLLQGVLTQFRMQLQQLGYGLDMVGNMQRQSHILNRVLNDSIYYAAGEHGSLIRLCDNPFTREYGEPVIEVREPFQRVHYISSFQHILANTIQETTVDVATVVTASSDGKYPVTVHLDKGMSSERQVEKAVETGLVWDNFKGTGFFSFLHPLLHPIETVRGMIKTASGSSDELLSKRVALWHLKEGLKDIYQGEILILGDATIRPHDLVYIADVYERCYGMIEVEAVTHHFTGEGFVTGITPNAIVTINDPARWTFIETLRGLFDDKNVKDDTRSLFQVFADQDSWVFKDKFTSEDELAQALQTQLKGHVHYTQGSSALIKDFTAAQATGLLTPSSKRTKYLEDRSKQSAMDGTIFGQDMGIADMAGVLAQQQISMNPFTNLLMDWAWDGWNWVRDNLIDQHGCYIQYLTKDGQPMDAGLSYANGIAVGSHHTLDILPEILGIKVNKEEDGHKRIAVNDILSALGWTEVDIASQYKFSSWWVNQLNSTILNAAGLSPDIDSLIDSSAKVEVVTVTHIVDGDTFDVAGPLGSLPIVNHLGGYRVRLAGVDAPELQFKGEELGYNNPSNPGYIAYEFTKSRIYDELIEEYGSAQVVVRQGTELWDKFDRKLMMVFHNAPRGLDAEARIEFLKKAAGDFPAVTWDSYLDDGRPYTLNWELVMNGLANVDMFKVGDWNDATEPVDD